MFKLLPLLLASSCYVAHAEIDRCLNVWVNPADETSESADAILVSGGKPSTKPDRHVMGLALAADIFLSNDCAVEEQTVEWVTMKSLDPQSGFMPISFTAKLVGYDDKARKLNTKAEKAPRTLLVDFKCSPTSITRHFNFSATLGGIKDVSAGNGTSYEEITFDFQKVCLPPPAVFDDEWNPAAIFFLVVFILMVIGCIGGCGYNYTVKGRSGAKMIPGHDCCLSLKEKFGGGVRNRTPQMNYEENLTDNGGNYGSNYQTDL